MERTAATQHILVLEDDSSISELLSWILADAGYEVTCVDTLREARSFCMSSEPDVIIADLLLPDGLGSDLVLETNEERNGNGPASIVLSAVPQARNRAEAAGADLYLTKPFDIGELLDAISDLTATDSREFQMQ